MRVVLGLALAAAALTAAASAPAARQETCASARGAYLASANARVFQRRDRSGFLASYACLLPRGRMWRLGRDDPAISTTIERAVLASRFVGFAAVDCDGLEENCGARVRVVDLRSGKVVRSARAFGREAVSFGVSDLVLARNGDAAWIAVDEHPDEDVHPRQVRIATTARGSQLLDAGTEVAVGSLALAGRRLYWMHAGQPVSARLP